jgi:ATP-dependent Clp protease ATP-binding subunit ClpC
MPETIPPLVLATVLFCHDLFQGEQVAFPLAEPDRVGYGDPDELQDELQLYLEERLRDAPPSVLARYSLPPAVSLELVEVPLSVEGGPAFPVSVPCVLVPDGKARWVVVPPLGHTFYLAPGEKLHESAEREVRRMVDARADDPFALLGLLPGREQQLARLSLSLVRAGTAGEEGAATRRKGFLAQRKKRKARELLAEVATPLLDETPAPAPPLYGRDAALRQLSDLLNGDERLSVAIIGAPLVGKGALFRAWLQEAAQKEPRRAAYAVSGAQLIAGAGGFGRWQQRVIELMDAAHELDAVLYFEDLAELLAERKSDGPDLAGAMRPYLSDNKVRVVGELSSESVDRVEGRHVGFFSALHRLTLEALDAAQTKQIIAQRLVFDRQQLPHRLHPGDEIIAPLVDLTERYLPYQSLPGKAVRFYEELRAFAEKDAGAAQVPLARVFEAFSVKTGIPEKLLREDRGLAVAEVARALKSRLIGQEEAVRRVAEVVCVVKAGLQPTGRPLATFLFVGPTGVGKTELARSLAAYLFGSESRMVRFDMSEFMDPDAAERLIRGSARGDGLLTRKLRQEPFCVLLLDEIEKAHPAVFDLLLQVLGEGRLTDSRGRTAYFHNAIIIMTSNLGAAFKRPASGFTSSPEEARAFYERQVEKNFRPEFVNRLDRVISFAPLTQAETRQVGQLLLQKVAQRNGFTARGIELRASAAALQWLTQEGYSEAYGARALRRYVEDELVAPAARLLGELDHDRKGSLLDVSMREETAPKEPILSAEHGSLRLSLVRGDSGASSSRSRFHFEQLSDLRRSAARVFALERVAQVRERVEFLVSQLSVSAHRKNNKDPRAQIDIAALQSEHHRLSGLWRDAATAGREIEELEELALLSLLEGQETKSYLDAAYTPYHALRKNFCYLLCAQDPRRDEAWIRLEELDDGRALDYWLVPLLSDELARRGWSAELHLARDFGPADPNWPSERTLGPARSPEHALRWLSLDARPSRFMLMRIRGPYAGIFLALEGGVHRLRNLHPRQENVHLQVTLLAMSGELTREEWLAQTPEPPPSEVAAAPAIREYHAREKRLYGGAGAFFHELTSFDDYWREIEDIAYLHLLSLDGNIESTKQKQDRDEVFLGSLERERAAKKRESGGIAGQKV